MEDLKALKISEKEVKAIDAYRGLGYKLVNSLLELGLANETEIHSKLEFIPYDEFSVKNALETIVDSYSAMVKNSYNIDSKGMQVYRGTTQEEISRISKSKNIGRFISTTSSKEMAEGYFSLNWDKPAAVYVTLNSNIPFIDMSDVIGEYGDNWEKETLLAPFTQVDSLKEISRYDGKNYYSLNISRQDLPEIDEKDRKLMQKEILDNADEMGKKLTEYFKAYKEMENLEEKDKYFSNRTSISGLSREDRTFLHEQLTDIREKKSNLYSNLKEYEVEISDWKSKIINYCKGECREVEKSIEHNVKQEEHELNVAREKERVIKANNMLSGIKTNCTTTIQDTVDLSNTMHHTLDDVSNDQKQYESLSNKFGIKYSKWYSSDKDKEALNNLNNKLKYIDQEIHSYNTDVEDIDRDYPIKKAQLDELLSSNREVFNLLKNVQNNNLYEAKQKELNVFKKSIMNRFVELKAKADIKRLDVNKKEIESKSGFRKVIDRLTGKQKIDEFKKDQIYTQKNAVLSTLNNIDNTNEKSDTKKYSVHEILSNMDKYILDNEDNVNLKSDIQEIISLRQNIGQVFKVNEKRIKSLNDESKSKELLPVDNKKIDKLTKIKMESDNWIIQNGYDSKDIKTQLIKPEDNTYYDVSKIINYIDSSLESETKSNEIVKNGDNRDIL